MHQIRNRKSLIITFALLVSVAWPIHADPCDVLQEELIVHSSDVKDQCSTGTCWAHPLTSSMEQKIRKEHSMEVSLSEEFLYLSTLLERFTAILKHNLMNEKWVSRRNKSVLDDIREGQSFDEGVEFGMVPDSVVQSNLITSSYNIFFNGKRRLYKDLRRLEQQAIATRKKSGGEAAFTELNAELNKLRDEHLKKVPGSWRRNEDGLDQFLFQGEWYSPHQFVHSFIFKSRTQTYESLFSIIEISNQEQSLTKIEEKLKAGETVPLVVAWRDDPKFEWFHNNFGHKSSRHAVEIVGVIKVNGKVTEVRIKNSWGKNWKATNWWSQDNGGFINIPVKDFFNVAETLLLYQARLWVAPDQFLATAPVEIQ
jgi:hypothetical protein